MRPAKAVMLAIAGLAILATACPAHARGRVVVPIGVRITAYVNEKPQGVRPEYEWTVDHKGTRYQLYVLKVSIVGRVRPSDIERAVRPYAVAFQLAGPTDTIAKLAAFPRHQPVILVGNLRFSGASRMMLVESVEESRDP
jgi:hypothetical protein